MGNLREILAERVSPLKARIRLDTPLLNEIATHAQIVSSESVEISPLAFESGGLKNIPVFARGKAYGDIAGLWYFVSFPQVLKDAQVVAVAEGRKGTVPPIQAPAISIALIEVASASVSIPTIDKVDFPTTTIPFVNESFPYLVSDVPAIQKSICEPVNKIVASLYTAQSKINDVIGRLNQALGKIKTGIDGANASIEKLGSNAETAINDGLNKARDNTQRAFNGTIQNTRDAVNKGIANLIPGLYNSWGLPTSMIITPVHVRNVSSSGFEFQSYGKTTIHYIAFGSKI